jgi:hypothetical protein
MPGSTSPVQRKAIFEEVQALKAKKEVKPADIRELSKLISTEVAKNDEKIKNCLKPISEFIGKNKAVIENATQAVPALIQDLNRALDQSLALFVKDAELQSTKVTRKGSSLI